MKIEGFYKDTYIYPSGKIIEKEWKKNSICTSGLNCICMILRGEDNLNLGIDHIWYGVGIGDPDWDLVPVSASHSDTSLVDEVMRINPTVLSYYSGGYPTETPTNELYMETSLSATDLVGYYLREFGLFIGNATAIEDSGYMLNHVNHTAIHKGSFSLRRQLRIVFNY